MPAFTTETRPDNHHTKRRGKGEQKGEESIAGSPGLVLAPRLDLHTRIRAHANQYFHTLQAHINKHETSKKKPRPEQTDSRMLPSERKECM